MAGPLRSLLWTLTASAALAGAAEAATWRDTRRAASFYAVEGWHLVTSSSSVFAGPAGQVIYLITYWRETPTAGTYVRCIDILNPEGKTVEICETAQ